MTIANYNKQEAKVYILFMGGTQSAQTEDGVAITTSVSDSSTDNGYFGVRVVSSFSGTYAAMLMLTCIG